MFGSLCQDASLNKALQETVALHGQYLSGMSNFSFLHYSTLMKHQPATGVF